MEQKTVKTLRIGIFLLLVVFLSVALFVGAFRYDNKYTYIRPDVRDGAAHLNRTAYAKSPLVLLVDGWEFYQYKLLTPQEIPGHTPDARIYLGQYNSFALGDADSNPHGEATYRLTLFTDSIQREYALELPEIFSAYRLWVNGELLAEMGDVEPGSYAARTADRFLTFSAVEKIEIVVAVSDYTHYYSGIVYPPAFGSPGAVHRMILLRLLLHSAACAVALLIGGFCLLLGLRQSFSANPMYLALLCLLFVGYAGYPIVHNLGLDGEFWYSLERTAYYAMLAVLNLLLCRLCGITRKIYLPAAGISALVCLLSAFPQLFYNGTLRRMLMLSRLLVSWQWLTALLLIASAVWGLRKNTRSPALLAGGLIYAAALICNRVLPVYEPVLGGWFGEIAGFLMLLIIAGTLWRDTIQVYRESLVMREQRSLLQTRLEMQMEAARIEQAYTERVHKLRHELRGHLSLLDSYHGKAEYDTAADLIRQLLAEDSETVEAVRYTENALINDILTVKLAVAKRLGAVVEWDLDIPDTLPLPDRDIMSLLYNILDNALNALDKAEPQKRWMRLSVQLSSGLLLVSCKNAYAGELLQRDGKLLTTRENKDGHGFGLAILREIAERYGGLLDVDFDGGVFAIHATLNLNFANNITRNLLLQEMSKL